MKSHQDLCNEWKEKLARNWPKMDYLSTDNFLTRAMTAAAKGAVEAGRLEIVALIATMMDRETPPLSKSERQIKEYMGEI